MTTPTLELPTILVGIGSNAAEEIVAAFVKLDAEITSLRERVQTLEDAPPVLS